jgi:SLIT-ROBO Rho GTPase activating protein
MAIFQEINDFIKKRAELDLQYSKELDKLVKSVMLKHKNEKQRLFILNEELSHYIYTGIFRRTNWFLYSICNLWQQMVDDAKEEAKQRAIMAEVIN